MRAAKTAIIILDIGRKRDGHIDWNFFGRHKIVIVFLISLLIKIRIIKLIPIFGLIRLI